MKEDRRLYAYILAIILFIILLILGIVTILYKGEDQIK